MTTPDSVHTLPAAVRPWFLVLDDDPALARVVGRFARGVVPCDVVCVGNVRELLEGLDASVYAPAGIVLDFELGRGETGVGALERLRHLGHLAPCALLTGAPDRARAALAASPLGETPPVFSKGTESMRLAAWLERVADGFDPKRMGRGSGLRVKADPVSDRD